MLPKHYLVTYNDLKHEKLKSVHARLPDYYVFAKTFQIPNFSHEEKQELCRLLKQVIY